VSPAAWEKAARGAGAATLLAAVLVVWAWTRAASLEPLPGPAEAAPVQRARAVAPRRGYPADVVVAAALEDPFRPASVPPPAPAAPAEAVPASSPAPVAPVRLVGTMVFPDGRAAAVCQVGSEPARIVRVGEAIGGYTVARVEPGRALLTGPGGRLELSVPKPGA
jgi:hypothetical protein